MRFWKTLLIAALSLLWPGAGHAVGGRPRRGCVLFVLNLLCFPLIACMTRWIPGAQTIGVLVFLYVCYVAIYFWIVRDAVTIPVEVSRSRKRYRPATAWGASLVMIAIYMLIPGPESNSPLTFPLRGVPVTSTVSFLPPESRILVNRAAYSWDTPVVGDFVLVTEPDTTHSLFRRVVACEPDRDAILCFSSGTSSAIEDAHQYAVVGRAECVYWPISEWRWLRRGDVETQ